MLLLYGKLKVRGLGMSFGLDGSFSQHDAKEEAKNVRALLFFGVAVMLMPVALVAAVLLNTDAGQALNTVEPSEVSVEVSGASSKFTEVDLKNPVIKIENQQQESAAPQVVAKAKNSFSL